MGAGDSFCRVQMRIQSLSLVFYRQEDCVSSHHSFCFLNLILLFLFFNGVCVSYHID
jgi:hypothetical protein